MHLKNSTLKLYPIFFVNMTKNVISMFCIKLLTDKTLTILYN